MLPDGQALLRLQAERQVLRLGLQRLRLELRRSRQAELAPREGSSGA